MTLRLLSLICLFLIADGINAADGSFSRAKMRELIDSSADPLCGIWQMGGDGATVAIIPEKASSARFDIILVDSPDMSVIPGKTIGHAVATGKSGTYDASIKSERAIGKRTHRFIISLTKDGNLEFSSYKKGRSIALWRWIPYLYRISVSDRDTRPTSADGATRLYPSNRSFRPVVL